MELAEFGVFSAEGRAGAKTRRWEIAYCHGGRLKRSVEMGSGHCGNLDFSLNGKQIRTFYEGFLKFKSIFKGCFTFCKDCSGCWSQSGGIEGG